ncbi:MAG: hypothetical protein IJX17_08075, partial [Clostridia bacterium]|nr:hypothetical protein [Clostridia bacterium]
FKTDYVDTSNPYPIVAKGIMTASGLPTAIRMVNGEILFYRTDIGATANPGDEMMDSSGVASEVKTINYTSYVDQSVKIFVGSKSQKVNYINSVKPSYNFSSDMDVSFVQRETIYGLGMADEYFAISVLDDFQAFFHIPVTDSMTFHFMMVVGFVSVIPVLFKALLASMIRILDLMFLILMGPVAIATNSLEVQNKPMRIFEEWRRKLTNSLLSAFGLVASFSLYYILISTTMNMTFITEGDRTMQILSNNPLIQGVVGFLGKLGVSDALGADFFNTIIKWCFILVASMMIQSAAELLGELITGGRVPKSFNSQLSDQDPVEGVTKIVNSVKDTAAKLRDVYTGEALINAMHAAKETAVRSIPGSSVVRAMNEGLKKHKDKKNAKKMSKLAQERGVSKGVADQLTKEIAQTRTKIRQEKQKQHAQKANKFLNNMGISDDNSQFFSKAQISRMGQDDSAKKKNPKTKKHRESKKSKQAKKQAKKDAKKKAKES